MTADDVDPHAGQSIESTGALPERATVGIVMLHGRGTLATGMFDLAGSFWRSEVAYLAPQAARNTWYPNRFLAPIEANQPHLDSALDFVARTLDTLADAGVPPERTVLLGFSQGACLGQEFAARNSRRYGSVVGFSGGLIGPEGTEWDYEGSLDGTPVFLGCGDADPHIPVVRVRESAHALSELGGAVTERIYPGMSHTVNDDEVEWVEGLLDSLLDDDSA